MAGQNQENSVLVASLDADWVKLIMMARELGISKEVVRAFLTEKTLKTSSPKKHL